MRQLQVLQSQLNLDREKLFGRDTKKFHARSKPRDVINEKDLLKDILIVAESSGAILGYVWGRLAERRSSISSKLGYLEEVCVDPDARGRGIAKRLLKELIVAFRARGCDHVITHTDAENLTAQALYRSIGMKHVTLELWKPL